LGDRMMSEKDLLLLKHFRTDGRQSLTRISKKTRIPISTIYDKLKAYEKSIILKHTTLLDFRQLGFEIRLRLFIAAEQKEALRSFLLIHDRVNTVCRINNGYDFEIEALFRNMGEFQEFMDDLEQFQIIEKREHFILDELRREGFMTIGSI
jgi:DNA-binding Lrp family transcriptional regulator